MYIVLQDVEKVEYILICNGFNADLQLGGRG